MDVHPDASRHWRRYEEIAMALEIRQERRPVIAKHRKIRMLLLLEGITG
jgi:hypothetical protein